MALFTRRRTPHQGLPCPVSILHFLLATIWVLSVSLTSTYTMHLFSLAIPLAFRPTLQ